MPPSPPYRAGAAASSAPEAGAPREPPPGTRRAQAAVSGGIRSARHSGAISGRTWVARPNQWRRRRGGHTESAAGLLQSTPPSRTGDSPRKVAFAISGERPAGPRRSCRVGGPGPVTEKRLPGAPPPLPLGSPHLQGLKMLRSTWNFLKRHKKKCIFLGTVLGGG